MSIMVINCCSFVCVIDPSFSQMEPSRLDWLVLAKRENKARTAAVLLPQRSILWGHFIQLNQNIRYVFHYISLRELQCKWHFRKIKSCYICCAYTESISMIEIWAEAQAFPSAIDWEPARGGAPVINTSCKAECVCCRSLPSKDPEENKLQDRRDC